MKASTAPEPSVATVALDPWTVYGELAGGADRPGQLAFWIDDIGVLPPAGHYRGTMTVEGSPRPVRLIVDTRPQWSDVKKRRITVELLDHGAVSPSPVAIAFKAVEL